MVWMKPSDQTGIKTGELFYYSSEKASHKSLLFWNFTYRRIFYWDKTLQKEMFFYIVLIIRIVTTLRATFQRGSLDKKHVTDNKTFWKTIKPFFSDKTYNSPKIRLVEKGVNNEEKITETFNIFFTNIVSNLRIPPYRSSHRWYSVRKGDPRNFAKSTGKDSGTGVFLWILQNFYEHLFYRRPPGKCFCPYQNNDFTGRIDPVVWRWSNNFYKVVFMKKLFYCYDTWVVFIFFQYIGKIWKPSKYHSSKKVFSWKQLFQFWNFKTRWCC